MEDGPSLKLISVSSRARQSGLIDGDIIIQCDSRPVSSLLDFYQVLFDRRSNKPLPMWVQRGAKRQLICLNLEKEAP